MGTFVGIDLGTTYSVVAAVSPHGTADVLRDDQGRNLTPSVVDLSVQPPIVGWQAKDSLALGDPGVYSLFKQQMANSQVIFLEDGRTYTPVDLSAFVLRHIKQFAEQRLGQPVTDAVVTVPAYFKDPQRRATHQAAEQAGLNVLRTISEPTAAALAFGVRPTNMKAKYLVYDLGGGTFDVTLVEIAPDELRVIGTEGDHDLGGKNWDERIFLYLAARFRDEFGIALDIGDTPDLMARTEDIKKRLSEQLKLTVPVHAEGRTGRYELTREALEDMTGDLLLRTVSWCEQALSDQKMTWTDLEGVILVGGSTRMPAIRRLIEEKTGKTPLAGVQPDEAVAIGAAIQAAMDYEDRVGTRFALAGRKAVVTDVTGSSMGMIALSPDGSKYVNSIIVSKNSTIPCAETRPYTLKVRGGGNDKLEVFMTQGESDSPMECLYLGKYVFTGIPSLSSKTAVLDITYSYNVSGTVDVSAVERSTKSPLKVSIESLPPDVPDRFMLPPVVENTREHLTLYMAFDLSGSMEDEPLEKAQEAAIGFLDQSDLSNTSIGIVEFSERAAMTVEATQSARKIRTGINDLTIGRTGYGTTGDPFEVIFSRLRHQVGLRYALILTDGIWENQEIALRRAKRCHEVGIEVIAVGFGDADRAFLRRISSRDEFSFFTELGKLNETFSSIAQELTESGGAIEAQSMTRLRSKLSLR